MISMSVAMTQFLSRNEEFFRSDLDRSVSISGVFYPEVVTGQLLTFCRKCDCSQGFVDQWSCDSAFLFAITDPSRKKIGSGFYELIFFK